jgi:RNA polymerase sigma-70 factor (ECF subfamily)
MKEILQQAILKLPLKYRTVFILREVEQLSTEETAEYLELSQENVKVRLLRSKTMIRKELMRSAAAEELFDFYLTRCDRIAANVMNRILEKEEA